MMKMAFWYIYWRRMDIDENDGDDDSNDDDYVDGDDDDVTTL